LLIVSIAFNFLLLGLAFHCTGVPHDKHQPILAAAKLQPKNNT